MAGRICRRCGAPIEEYRSARAWLCSSCADTPSRGDVGHIKWCQRFAEARRRESAARTAARAAEGAAAPRDRAAVVYAVGTSHDGTCVVEWRGTVPAHLRFVHGQGGM